MIYLYGAGGHAKVVADVLKSRGVEIVGVFDDNPETEQFMELSVSHDKIVAPVLVSIGNNAARKKVAERIAEQMFVDAVSAATATVSSSAMLGKGTVVMQGAIVQSSVVVGKHCIINTGATIDHDCRLGNYVHIAPRTVLCGNVEVGEGALIGAGTVIIPGIKIGKWALIGAGSTVVSDIPDGATAFGSPCKIKK
jgi:acetyltransferase EpsM